MNGANVRVLCAEACGEGGGVMGNKWDRCRNCGRWIRTLTALVDNRMLLYCDNRCRSKGWNQCIVDRRNPPKQEDS